VKPDSDGGDKPGRCDALGPARSQDRSRQDRSRQDRGPQRVGASLVEAARLMGAGAALDLATLESQWASVVGANLASHCHPASFEKGVLVVSADHNAWAAELRFHSVAVTERARSLVPRVASLVVRVQTS